MMFEKVEWHPVIGAKSWKGIAVSESEQGIGVQSG